MRSPELYRSRLSCEPLSAYTYSGHPGVHLHGALMAFLQQYSPALVQRLHAPPPPDAGPAAEGARAAAGGRTRRAFCLGPLTWSHGDYLTAPERCRPGHSLAFAVAAADAELAALLREHLVPGAQFHLGRQGREQPWRVLEVTAPRQQVSRLAELYAQAVPRRRLDLHLLSPTLFKTNSGGCTVLPDPAKVFAGLAQHAANLFPGVSPAIAGDEPTALVRWHVAVEALDLATRSYGEGPGSVGSVGRLAMKASGDLTEDQLRYLNLLLSLAPYVGIGAKTSRGYGQAGTEAGETPETGS